jgi:hypothetical protein
MPRYGEGRHERLQRGDEQHERQHEHHHLEGEGRSEAEVHAEFLGGNEATRHD